MGKVLERDIREWALENYEHSYGASVLIECYEDGELSKEFKTLADAKRYAKLVDEQHANAHC